MPTDAPVANFSDDFQAPFNFRGNYWVQTGVDTDWTELDVTASTPALELGPVQIGAMGGVYYLPFQDEDIILTAQVSGETNVADFTVRALYQWYWEGLEDERFQLSVARTFSVAEQVGLDVEVGHSWIQSGAEPSYAVIGLPIARDGYTIRPFVKGSWGVEGNLAFGIGWNW